MSSPHYSQMVIFTEYFSGAGAVGGCTRLSILLLALRFTVFSIGTLVGVVIYPTDVTLHWIPIPCEYDWSAICCQLQRPPHNLGERRRNLYHPFSWLPNHMHRWVYWGTHPIPYWTCCEAHSWEFHICGYLCLTWRQMAYNPPWPLSLQSLSVDFLRRLEGPLLCLWVSCWLGMGGTPGLLYSAQLCCTYLSLAPNRSHILLFTFGRSNKISSLLGEPPRKGETKTCTRMGCSL